MACPEVPRAPEDDSRFERCRFTFLAEVLRQNVGAEAEAHAVQRRLRGEVGDVGESTANVVCGPSAGVEGISAG